MSENENVISDEAVEAAAKAIFESRGKSKWDDASEFWSGAKESTRKEAQLALEAAEPYMQVERRVPPLTEAEWDALRQLPNPYRGQA